MTPNHLFGDRSDDVGERESADLFRHVGVIDHLQQQIAQLFAQRIQVLPCDGVRHLIRFLDCIGGNRGEALLEIPRAARPGIAQPRHHVEQAIDRARIVGHRSAPSGKLRGERPFPPGRKRNPMVQDATGCATPRLCGCCTERKAGFQGRGRQKDEDPPSAPVISSRIIYIMENSADPLAPDRRCGWARAAGSRPAALTLRLSCRHRQARCPPAEICRECRSRGRDACW